MQKRLFVCEDFDDKARVKLISLKCNVLLCFKINCEIKSIGAVEVISAQAYSELGSWKAFDKNTVQLEQIKKRNPSLFQHNGFELFKAFQKYFLWHNYYKEMLELACDTFLKANNNSWVYKYDEGFLKPYKQLFSVYQLWVKSFFISRPKVLPNQKIKTPYVFCIYHPDNFNFWENLVENFEKEEITFLIYSLNNNTDHFKKLTLLFEEKGYQYVIVPKIKKYGIAGINPFTVNLKNAYFYRYLLEHTGAFGFFCEYVESILSEKNKALVVLGMENSHFGNLFCEASKKCQIKVFNTMNGAKGSTANNAAVDFYKWLVWSESLKKMLNTNCGVSEQQLHNLDHHLVEDLILKHKFSDSLQLDMTGIEGKKVISLFLPPNINPIVGEVLSHLVDMVNQKLSYFLIVRPHPLLSKRKVLEYLGGTNPDRVNIIEVDTQNSRDSLYDQLSLSQLSICFGSTVVIESRYFGVPAITFENLEKSMLLEVDNDTIFHAQEIAQLQSMVEKLLYQPIRKKSYPKGGVAAIYAKAIKSL